jgi:hypothetical protein
MALAVEIFSGSRISQSPQNLGPLGVAAVVHLALFQPPIRAGSGAEADNQ